MKERTTDRPLLILDLDETLIFGAEIELPHAPDFRVGPFYIYQRPHLFQFLASAHQHFDMSVWSSASHDYVSAITSNLSRNLKFDWVFVWSRDRCTQRTDPEWRDTIYLKDLKKTKPFGYPKERILIVDDTRQKVSRNYGNAVYPSRFEGDVDDNELLYLSRFLATISGEPNFRSIEKRGWRNRIRLDKDRKTEW